VKPAIKSVHRLLPEIDLIRKKELRKRVAAVWQDAIASGGWRMKDLDKIPFTLLIPGIKISLIHHTRAVTRTAIAIAQTLSSSYGKDIMIDMDTLIAGAVLHDVGKLLEYVRKGRKIVKSREGSLLRHPFSGQALAFKHGLPYEILHMIAYHSKEGDLGKRTTEAIIIHHADFVNFEPLKP
jgi:putative nucleotidyltransferase with HDIG domain